MANPIYMGSEKYKIPNQLEVSGEFSYPILSDISTPPSDPTKPALGQYNSIQYNWDTVNQIWIAGSGGDNTNWTPGNSFAS